ncbi:transient-receptor-potential-like protein isoform X2 [Tribolium castaneum]|nr:PREDICTED: transient-receptor-potential-like protein isoform X2 [Tribolium castaneum]|eukprot:XP_015834999.1 PREDICTED: transient-receptor-potential-like protein isoform X2 [Tribolium castaneum]
MPNLPKSLSIEEKKYLLAIERGDMANVRRMLQKAHRKKSFDINCVDSLGRGALSIAIDQEHLEMVELLVIMGVETRDALLHAIHVEFVEAVELLLEHEELIHKDGEPYSWQKVDINTAMFTPDITPLTLAAHRNNYEILKILLDRGATIPMPHDIKCGCDECIKESEEDYLRHSLARLNEYKALASPSLIALSSSDPILTAFQLSWELRNLAFAEPECKSEYMDLRRQCQQFAVDLLHQTRSSQELAFILNHDPAAPPYEEGEHMKLARLELAIQYKQKKFVAHPNIQQLLAAIWYEGVPGFRRKSSTQKIMIIVKVAVLFPFYCMLYMITPGTKTGKLMRKPFMKFLIHASSYLFFLFLLILVSQRAEDQIIELFGTESMKQNLQEKYRKQRGNPPTILEYVVLIYVIGFIFEETHEIYVEGMKSYLRNLWNFIDFTRNFLYTAVFLLRVAAYIQQTSEIENDPFTAYIRREEWQAFDPQLIAEGLFAAANIFSALKLVHLFSINPHLGPLQISLGRMVIDIVKFFFIYTLVLFAFACGLNQLLWYFSDLEKKKCYHLPSGEADFDNAADSCMKWRRFANVFESSQSLFWASFGMVDLASFELTGIKTYTRFWGLLMFGSYSVINVIVLLNLLIAMMSNSYAMIDEHSDTEWKFARTKLWMSYFEESATLPSPFNIFPKPKHLFKLLGLRKKDKIRKMSTKRRNREEKERDYKYTAVMRALVWRYVSAMHRKLEENAVTEDDVNELKSDISSFRYELLEVLQKNGMDISSAEMKEKAVLGRKMKVWERRLMKDFKVAPVVTEEEEEFIYQPPPEGENSLAKFRRIARLAVVNSNLSKWRQVVKGACIASQIGHCHSRDSFKKQQNLQRAMEEARKLKVKSPDQSRATTPIQLPDTTGSNIIKIIRGITPETVDTKYCLTPRDKSPLISISPPKTPEKEPDLINLESAKTSPVLPVKAMPSDDVSLESVDKIINDSNSLDDDKVRSLPTSPTSSDDKSLDSLSKKALFSSGSFTPEENEKKEEETEPKNVTFSFDFIDESSKGESSAEILKKSEEETEENLDKSDEPEPSLEETKEESEEVHDLPEETVQAKSEDEVEETENNEIEEPQADLEESEPQLDEKEEESQVKSEELTVEEKEIQVEVEKVCAKSVDELEAPEKKEEVEEKIEKEKSPLAVRNIQRIGDRGRRQPKTGWL